MTDQTLPSAPRRRINLQPPPRLAVPGHRVRLARTLGRPDADAAPIASPRSADSTLDTPEVRAFMGDLVAHWDAEPPHANRDILVDGLPLGKLIMAHAHAEIAREALALERVAVTTPRSNRLRRMPARRSRSRARRSHRGAAARLGKTAAGDPDGDPEPVSSQRHLSSEMSL